jgi:L-fucose mutarotase
MDPVLGPDLLAILRAMGHGDEIVIADANFPSASHARRLVRADGIAAPRLVRAVVRLMPLDDFVKNAAFRMAITGNPDEVPPIASEFSSILASEGYKGEIEALERFDFYQRASQAYAIVASGEERLWGNLILKKGAIRPDNKATA